MVADTDFIRYKPRFLQRSSIYSNKDEVNVEKILKKNVSGDIWSFWLHQRSFSEFGFGKLLQFRSAFIKRL